MTIPPLTFEFSRLDPGLYGQLSSLFSGFNILRRRLADATPRRRPADDLASRPGADSAKDQRELPGFGPCPAIFRGRNGRAGTAEAAIAVRPINPHG